MFYIQHFTTSKLHDFRKSSASMLFVRCGLPINYLRHSAHWLWSVEVLHVCVLMNVFINYFILVFNNLTLDFLLFLLCITFMAILWLFCENFFRKGDYMICEFHSYYL